MIFTIFKKYAVVIATRSLKKYIYIQHIPNVYWLKYVKFQNILKPFTLKKQKHRKIQRN